MSDAQPLVLHVLEALEGGTSRHLVDVVHGQSSICGLLARFFFYVTGIT